MVRLLNTVRQVYGGGKILKTTIVTVQERIFIEI